MWLGHCSGTSVAVTGLRDHDVVAFDEVHEPMLRDSDLVRIAGKVLLKGLRVPRPLTVRTEMGELRVGPDGGAAPVTLATTTFDAFRWRMGRRSRRQLAAMDWDGDPAPYLDSLCVFGPAAVDVIE